MNTCFSTTDGSERSMESLHSRKTTATMEILVMDNLKWIDLRESLNERVMISKLTDRFT